MQRHRQDPVAEIDQARSSIRGDHAIAFDSESQDLEFRMGWRQRCRPHFFLVQANRVPQLERTLRPAVAPSHRAIDVVK